jgi:hypothetical protein
MHPRLRHVAVTSMFREAGGPVRGVCGVLLRQRHFPRLRRLIAGAESGVEYPV